MGGRGWGKVEEEEEEEEMRRKMIMIEKERGVDRNGERGCGLGER